MLDSAVARPRYIFLSHNSTDKPEAIRFAEVLENRPLAQTHKLQVWLDKNNLEHGVQYTNQFAKYINHADTCAFLLFMPREPIRAYVDYEIGIALDRHLGDKNGGKRFPILPIYPGARSGRVALPEAIRIFNYREYVYDDVQQIDAIIADALGLGLVGASPAGDLVMDEESLAGFIPTKDVPKDGYAVWLSFVLTRHNNNLQAEDDEGNIIVLPVIELPGIDASPQQLQPLAVWLLGEQAIDGIKGRVRIMTNDPVLAMLPWHRLPHPHANISLLNSGWMIETGAVQGRSYRIGFSDIAPHTPLLVIPSHHKHEIAGDKHYSLVQSYLEAYLDIHSLIPRFTNPQSLKRALRHHQPDLLYIYARFNGERLELDSGMDGDDRISLDTLGTWIADADINPVVILNLIGESLKYYPEILVKSSRLVWIQATSRTKKLGDLDKHLEKVMMGTSRNGDFGGLILQQTAQCHRGMQNLLWINGQTPWLDTREYGQKHIRRLRAALLKVMLGRESLKHHMAGVIYTHLSQHIPLSAYVVTGDVSACPHDVPAQIQYRLQWEDKERSVSMVQFYFHINIEPTDDIEYALDVAISEGILHLTDDVEQIFNRELERHGLQRQECCITLNWLFHIEAGQEESISGWLDSWGHLVCEYFSRVKLERAILINAICFQVQNEKLAQSVQSRANKELRNFRNLTGCSIQPIILKDSLGKLEADEISDFLEANQRYWYTELRLKNHHIDSWDFAEWVADQTNGLFEDTVNFIWKQYQHDYQDYIKR